MDLYSVYDADGAHFRMVDADQAEMLLDNNAARIDGKRRKIKLRLSVDLSTARSLLAPRYPVSQASKTFLIEFIGDDRTRIYQHHSGRCAAFGQTG